MQDYLKLSIIALFYGYFISKVYELYEYFYVIFVL